MKTELEYILEKRQVLLAVALGLLTFRSGIHCARRPGTGFFYVYRRICLATGFGKFRKTKLSDSLQESRGRIFPIFRRVKIRRKRSIRNSESLMKEKGRKGCGNRRKTGYGGILYTLGASDQNADRVAMSLFGGGHTGKWRTFHGTFSYRAVWRWYCSILDSPDPIWPSGQWMWTTEGCNGNMRDLHPEKDRWDFQERRRQSRMKNGWFLKGSKRQVHPDLR